MSIGAVLAEARRRSGLTVGDLSRQTRIREAIIHGIEWDDFSACGGDFYARGHIRAIAHAVGADPGPLIEEYDAAHRTTEEITDTVVLHPDQPPRMPERRRIAWIATLGLAVLAILGWAGYHFASSAGHSSGAAAAAADHASAHHQAGAAPHAAGSGSPQPAPTATPSAAPSTAAPVPAPAAVRALAPASADAFGVNGVGQGDDPQNAALAIGGDPSTPWLSDWYTTAAFGNLEAGTGLLVDMGRPVTITAAQFTLGGFSGADLQLRAGDVPALADLRPVADAAGAGGPVRLPLTTPVRARYVLIWFTKLPQDDAGTFRASVADVRVDGRP
ncbi:MAG TPA: helix-turn-helix transcriptional regulator [Streptosporangiaceae bacterium]